MSQEWLDKNGNALVVDLNSDSSVVSLPPASVGDDFIVTSPTDDSFPMINTTPDNSRAAAPSQYILDQSIPCLNDSECDFAPETEPIDNEPGSWREWAYDNHKVLERCNRETYNQIAGDDDN